MKSIIPYFILYLINPQYHNYQAKTNKTTNNFTIGYASKKILELFFRKP